VAVSSETAPSHGYQLQPEELRAQLSALAALGERNHGVMDSASELSGQLPMLGTAPPALHLARRLRELAGDSGLAGEVRAVGTDLNGFHGALKDTLDSYLDTEEDAVSTLRAAEGSAQ
jgi:hypothetical protein